MINGSFCDRDSAQPYAPNLSDQYSQYAPTPGYYNETLHSHFEFSPSPDRYPQGSPVASICAPQETPRLLQVGEWEASRPDDEFPPTFIRYTIEWKVKVNNRFRWEGTIKIVTLTPSAYWPSVLRPKLENVLQERIPRSRRVRSDGTLVVMSVNDRKHKNEKFWSAAGRGEKRGKSSVTKRMLGERDAQLDAEEHVSGEQSIWRAVYSLMRCPLPSCHLGPHCWQDPHGKKHYQLRTHHLKRLIAYVDAGGVLECQDDVPDAIREELYMEEQQKMEHSQSKNNKSLTPGNCPPININFMGGQSSIQPAAVDCIPQSEMSSHQKRHRFILLTIDGPRDVAVKEYSAWQETNVIDENLRAQFQLACDVTLANGLDLEQILEDQNPEFFVQEGIAVGIARRFVGDIIKWVGEIRNQ
ncbi:unnamed protein product [Penicillium pancosmium]